MSASIKRVEAALKELQQGKMIILTDDPDRENEGDLICAAETITKEQMSFIIRHSSGIVCLSMTAEQLKKLELPQMVPATENTSCRGTPFTISIDARDDITTGVSACDRVKTINVAISETSCSHDLVKPGHIFPLQAKEGGVLQRAGHTEGAIDLVRLSGFKPAAVLCELMNSDGTMTRGEQLEKFAKDHQLAMLSIADLIQYRLSTENLIAEEACASLPLMNYGQFDITVIKEKLNSQEHVILSKPSVTEKNPLVRIHSACITGDLFGSKRCDCQQQLNYSLQRISEEGGILIYLNQEGRGIGLFNKIKAYHLQEQGFDTIEANQQLGLPVDSREYYIAANVLRNRHIKQIRLLTNNPAKINELQKYGIEKIERETLPNFANEINQKYLVAKKNKLNHLFVEI